MSLAKLYTTKKSRKVWTCGSCREEIPVGSPVIHFAVGFRGREQHRCSKPECFPKPSDRESSYVAEVYAAQEAADFSSATSREDLEAVVQEVADACENVASEYESNEMYDINEDLQERAEMIRSAGEELLSWADSLDEGEPMADEDELSDKELADFAERHEAWLVEARQAAEDAVNQMDLP